MPRLRVPWFRILGTGYRESAIHGGELAVAFVRRGELELGERSFHTSVPSRAVSSLSSPVAFAASHTVSADTSDPTRARFSATAAPQLIVAGAGVVQARDNLSYDWRFNQDLDATWRRLGEELWLLLGLRHVPGQAVVIPLAESIAEHWALGIATGGQAVAQRCAVDSRRTWPLARGARRQIGRTFGELCARGGPGVRWGRQDLPTGSRRATRNPARNAHAGHCKHERPSS